MLKVGTRGRRMIGFAALAFLVGLGLSLAQIAAPPHSEAADASGAAAATTAAPEQVVRDALNRVLTILADPALDSPARRAQIENIAFDVFDFPTMSKLVLARNWKKFSKEQRKEFVAEFKQHLSRSYGNRLDRYQQTDVEIVGSRVEPRGDVTVLSKAVGGQFDGIQMNYRLRERSDRWRVIDVVIEGVSLVANFRSQFVEVVSRGGPEALLEELKTKNFDLPEVTPTKKGG